MVLSAESNMIKVNQLIFQEQSDVQVIGIVLYVVASGDGRWREMDLMCNSSFSEFADLN